MYLAVLCNTRECAVPDCKRFDALRMSASSCRTRFAATATLLSASRVGGLCRSVLGPGRVLGLWSASVASDVSLFALYSARLKIPPFLLAVACDGTCSLGCPRF